LKYFPGKFFFKDMIIFSFKLKQKIFPPRSFITDDKDFIGIGGPLLNTQASLSFENEDQTLCHNRQIHTRTRLFHFSTQVKNSSLFRTIAWQWCQQSKKIGVIKDPRIRQ
jgi:hypothetical protein